MASLRPWWVGRPHRLGGEAFASRSGNEEISPRFFFFLSFLFLFSFFVSLFFSFSLFSPPPPPPPPGSPFLSFFFCTFFLSFFSLCFFFLFFPFFFSFLFSFLSFFLTFLLSFSFFSCLPFFPLFDRCSPTSDLTTVLFSFPFLYLIGVVLQVT